MDLAMVGLGKMGANMAERLLAAGHRVVAHDLSATAVATVVAAGGTAAADLADAVRRLPTPRALWLMLPAGKVTEDALSALQPLLAAGDVVVDGGNSNYQDSIRRARVLEERGIAFVDVGTSGGILGKAAGYSMMVGGSDGAVALLRPALEALAPGPSRGWGHVGPAGAGHFVKMVHNGIEYGLMQAYAEGFHILREKRAMALNLHQVAEIWREGSIVSSKLLDLLSDGLGEDPGALQASAQVADSGEGRWTVAEAIALDVPAPIITQSVLERLRSRQESCYANRLLSLMRHKFGGHVAPARGPKEADKGPR